MRNQRRSIPKAVRQLAAENLATNLMSLPEIQHAKTIAVYYADAEEISLQPFIKQMWQQNKKILLPIMHENKLYFAPYNHDTKLKINKFNIAEPNIININYEFDVIILPMLAFDKNKNRLGRGAGYYDKFLATKINSYLIGVAFDCQQTAEITIDSWDIPLNKIVTEKNIL